MPAILTKEAQEAWLHGTAPLHFKAAFACLVPCRDELTALLTAAHLVSARVNSPKNHDAGLVAEAAVA